MNVPVTPEQPTPLSLPVERRRVLIGVDVFLGRGATFGDILRALGEWVPQGPNAPLPSPLASAPVLIDPSPQKRASPKTGSVPVGDIVKHPARSLLARDYLDPVPEREPADDSEGK